MTTGRLDLEIDAGDVRLPAGPARGGVVVLHGAEAGHRSFFSTAACRRPDA